jgi:hypothetical protein
MRQRIPTLLVLILIIAIIGLGLFIYFLNQTNNQKKIIEINPQELLVANITDNSASIIWHTDKPVVGKVQINNRSINDERDTDTSPKERVSHFITINSLLPQTDYQFQIEMNGLIYPDQPIKFKTISTELSERSIQEQTYPPIRGTILTQNQAPLEEGIIVLKLPNAIPKASFITINGNYVLPLTKIISNDLSDLVRITEKLPVTLEARKGQLASLIQLTLPVANQLVPVTLGKNENLIEFLSQPISTPLPLNFQQTELSFDLNNDGKVNTLDSSLITDLVQRRQFNQKADFNGDKNIDQKDLDLIKAQLQ